MDGTFYDGHDEIYHHAKFWEDRTTRAGCRCENVVFVFVTLRVRSAVRSRGVLYSSNTHCVALYRPISTRFGGLDLFFSEGIALSDTLHSSHIRR